MFLPGHAAVSVAAPRSTTSAQRLIKPMGELVQWVESKGGQLSVAFSDVATGQVVASHAPNIALNPASNMKVLTAAAALDVLGPGYGFLTGLYGKADGDHIPELVLRGHGDPSLETADLWRLASGLQSRGVQRVSKILVDQSSFDDQFIPPAFEQQPEEWASFRAPVSAVALDRNTVTLNVLPAVQGANARAWFEPEGVVKVNGQIATKARGKGQDVRLKLESSNTELIATVEGHVAEGLPRLRFTRRVADPRRVPGLALAHLLKAVGIQAPSSVDLGGTGSKERITYIQSAPVSVLVNELGKHSDNFYAEMLFKALGASSTGPATAEKGEQAVMQWLKSAGILDPSTIVRNGSGLFDANRLSASQLVQILSYVHNNPKTSAEFQSHLAIGGVDGTLRSRFRSLRAQRTVRAKTGTLAGADALSGYVTAGPDVFAFSILVNGIANRHHEARPRIDALVTAAAGS